MDPRSCLELDIDGRTEAGMTEMTPTDERRPPAGTGDAMDCNGSNHTLHQGEAQSLPECFGTMRLKVYLRGYSGAFNYFKPSVLTCAACTHEVQCGRLLRRARRR